MAGQLTDLTGRARWRVSSSKGGFGAEHLHDGSSETFWQSDGRQPHSISIWFGARQALHRLSLFLDIDRDESYTPCKAAVLSGTSERDMQPVAAVEFAQEPRGWVDIPLAEDDRPLMAHFVRIELPLNYENGRDVRVRQVRILGPPASTERFRAERILPFSTREFSMFDSLR
ncbi:Anaphase-promoting complex subunit 10 [Coemansia nantahalensis]|uniref:Anaphase-promoting complex subunit 10 n=2 Tax=Coemansia TaxID=4863 RepID=A0ACC1L6H3_9FUNG|nr:Anaphase-promoting complex subunit 10 [Coemansia nantahalensis]KAJ2770388.1 Anaphase-promoting complex subunit 10 [Coemansia nantahalensis]KAJ2801845.1 Anaphase-promoting complex subunit 10 [Coemansia helicoidea]